MLWAPSLAGALRSHLGLTLATAHTRGQQAGQDKIQIPKFHIASQQGLSPFPASFLPRFQTQF